jgi:hypothetical protein
MNWGYIFLGIIFGLFTEVTSLLGISVNRPPTDVPGPAGRHNGHRWKELLTRRDSPKITEDSYSRAPNGKLLSVEGPSLRAVPAFSALPRFRREDITTFQSARRLTRRHWRRYGKAIFVYRLVVPVFTYIAILKYRLYDIDLVINRALVYGSLTA